MWRRTVLSSLLVTPLLAALVFVALIASARTLRGLYRWAARRLERWIGPACSARRGLDRGRGGDPDCSSAEWCSTASWLRPDEAFSVRNGATEPGVVQPVVPRTGPGVQNPSCRGRRSAGRAATSLAPARLRSRSRPSRAAWRVCRSRAYAGLDSAATAEQRARLAVEDLARAGGFGRRTLVVVTTTGSGWVDPGAVDSVEYMTGGDSATRLGAVLLPPVVDVLSRRSRTGP